MVDRFQSLDRQIIEGLEEVDASPHFGGEDLWLTFYLSGLEQGLAAVAAALTDRGWINAGGWESGFIYPKKQVRKAAPDVLRLAREVEKLCDMHGAETLSIDADTSPDVERSKFVTLFQSPA